MVPAHISTYQFQQAPQPAGTITAAPKVYKAPAPAVGKTISSEPQLTKQKGLFPNYSVN